MTNPFPIGYQHDSDAMWPNPAGRRQADMIEMAHDGCTLMVPTLVEGDGPGQLVALLDEARQLGMRLILGGLNPSQMQAVVGHPALLAHYVQDDANTGGKTPDNLRQNDALSRAQDRAGLTYAAYGPTGENGFPEFMGITDLMGAECYPIGNDGTVGNVYDGCKQAKRSTDGTKTTPYGVLQTYRWPGQRLPTSPELRAMAACALAAGVEGIVFYSWQWFEKKDAQDPGRAINLKANVALRQAVRDVVGWTNQYADLLLNGQRVVLSENDVLDVAWTLEGQHVRLLVNRTKKAVKYAGQLLAPLAVRWDSP